MPPKNIITDMRTFSERYSTLSRGDAVVGLLGLRWNEELKLLHLVESGVKVFPSALAQAISRSKAMQAYVLCDFMVEGTFVARDKRDLIEKISEYNQNGYTDVVTKQDRMNCGMGVNIWPSLEAVYNNASIGLMPYPFVVQPFVKDVKDIRVVVIGKYVEAYERCNPHNFRNNIYFGGKSTSRKLNRGELSFCRRVMNKGHFPYAHVDLMLSDGKIYLSEINLRGGLKGAQIKRKDYEPLIQKVHTDYIKKLQT